MRSSNISLSLFKVCKYYVIKRGVEFVETAMRILGMSLSHVSLLSIAGMQRADFGHILQQGIERCDYFKDFLDYILELEQQKKGNVCMVLWQLWRDRNAADPLSTSVDFDG